MKRQLASVMDESLNGTVSPGRRLERELYTEVNTRTTATTKVVIEVNILQVDAFLFPLAFCETLRKSTRANSSSFCGERVLAGSEHGLG